MGEKLAIRRINVVGSQSTLFCDLMREVMSEFSNLGISKNSLGLYWEDVDADVLGIENTAGLLIALEDMEGPVYDVIAQLQNDDDDGRFIFQ